MAYTDLDRIAYRIGSVPYVSLDTVDQQRIDWAVSAVEQQLSLPPWNFRLASSLFTEYLPTSGEFRDDVDLADYSIGESGTVIPLDQVSGSSVLVLTHTPVLQTGLIIYEDTAGYAGQGDTPYGADTLLTAGTDYFLDCDRAGLSTSGRVHRISNSWSREPRSIRVTYYGGTGVAETAALGGSFLEIYQEVVVNAVLHNFTFWKRQQASIAAGDAGLVKSSESLGKYSVGLGSPSSTINGSQFAFGASPEVLPEVLTAPLTPFINVGALLCR